MTWLLSACHHVDGDGTCWAADCLAPGCLWTTTTSTPEATDDAANDHTRTTHGEEDE